MKIIRKETVELDRDEWCVFNNFYNFMSLLSGRVGDENLKRLLTTIIDTMETIEDYFEEE